MIEIHRVAESAFQSDLVDFLPGVAQLFTGIFQAQTDQVLRRRYRIIFLPFPVKGTPGHAVFPQQRISMDGPAAVVPEPDWSKYTVSADCGLFGPWFRQDDQRSLAKIKLPEQTFRKTFPGTFGTIPADEIPPDRMLLMRFHFALDSGREARVMFNTNANCRVFVDDVYVFGREGGRMAPSFHRAPCNQFTDLNFAAGTHEILAGIAPIGDMKQIQWVIGVGDPKSKQWLDVKWL